jgi:hypothetical protein
LEASLHPYNASGKGDICSSINWTASMLRLNSEADLIALHSGLVKENIHLEYKASEAIDKKSDPKKLEMARDISAFANADGGQIVYGMKENKDHEPDGLDAGLDPREYPEIWFEQVLQQHVTPLLSPVKPRHIPLCTGRVAVVIDIPATKSDPHQVDGRYYRRQNFNRLIMEHYEVRDMFRRQTSPDLSIDFFFDKMQKRQVIRYDHDANEHNPIGMTPTISNKSNEPSPYAVALVFVDARITILQTKYSPLAETVISGHKVVPYRLTFMPGRSMPIFKEQPTLMPPLGIIIPDLHLRSDNEFILAYEVRAPGCHVKGFGSLVAEYGQSLTIRMTHT